MVKRFVKVALCQRGVTGSKEQNIAETVSMIEEAAEHCPGLDLIIFPEYNYYEALSLEEARANSETMDGRYITEMKKQARRFGVNLIPGSFAETCGEKVKNTCALIDRSGEVAGSYSKVHLMDAIGIRNEQTVKGILALARRRKLGGPCGTLWKVLSSEYRSTLLKKNEPGDYILWALNHPAEFEDTYTGILKKRVRGR